MAAAKQQPSAKLLEAADSAQSHGWTVLETGDIDPRDLVVNEQDNGRHYAMESDGDMVYSLLQNGQISPITVRRTDKNKLKVVFGYRRVKAGIEILETGLQKGWKIRYELVEVDDRTAFLTNIEENDKRKALTDIDHAHNIKRMKDEFEMTQTDIAKRLAKSGGWVSLTLSLLNLSAAHQKLVARYCTTGTKGIPVTSAYELAQIEDPKERQEAVDEILAQHGGKVPRAAVRKRKKGKAGAEERKALTAKEIRMPFVTVVDKAKAEDRELEEWEIFCDSIGRYCMGKLSERSMINKVKEAFS